MSNGYDTLRSHLNPFFDGKNWQALLEALATGDDYLSELAANALKQMYLSSADGKYLRKNAADFGVQEYPGLNMDDESFRKLAIELASGRVTINSICKIIECYYGIEALHAYVDSIAGPFELTNGDTLVFKIENDEFVYSVNSNRFQNISAASVTELATDLTLFFANNKKRAFASVIEQDGAQFLRVYSQAIGLTSKISVIGGTMQPKVRFPELIDTYGINTVTNADGYTWVYSETTNSTVLSLTPPTTGIPKINVSEVQAGDYLVIGQDTPTKGWYKIKDVSYQWSGIYFVQTITLENKIGFTGSITQQSNSSYSFFRPVVETLASRSRGVFVSQAAHNNTLKVTIPATPSLRANEDTASYVVGQAAAAIAYLERKNGVVSVTTKTDHGLQTGNLVKVENFSPSIEPYVYIGSGTQYGASHLQRVSQYLQTSGYLPSTTCSIETFNGFTFITGGKSLGSSSGQFLIAELSRPALGGTTQAAGSAFTTALSISTGSMLCPREQSGISSTLFPEPGGVFVTGGRDSSTGTATVKAELISTTGVSYPLANMLNERYDFPQVTMNSGRIIVIGGRDSADFPLNVCEVYNPLSDGWATVATLNTPRAGSKAINLPDGKVFVMGGSKSSDPAVKNLNTTEIYDPTLNTWTYGESMCFARNDFSLTWISGTEFIVVGGYGGSPSSTAFSFLRETEIFNVETMKWRLGPKLPEVINGAFLTTAIDGVVYAATGTSVYWLDLQSLQWKLVISSTGTNPCWLADQFFGFDESSSKLNVLIGSNTVNGPSGINGVFPVNVLSSTEFNYQSSGPYTTNMGTTNKYVQLVRTGGNTVTVPLSIPLDTTHVFINSKSGPFPSGIKQVDSIGESSFTYIEAGTNSISATNTTYVALDSSRTAKATAVSSSGLSGNAFIVDPSSFQVSKTVSETVSDVPAGNLTILKLTDVSGFEESGLVIIGYGTEYESQPIKYIAKISASELLLESGQILEFTPSGTEVRQVLSENLPFSYLWITGTALARLAAYRDVLESTANDVELIWNIIFPDDRGLGGEKTSHSDNSTVWG